jgi:hypothetical protein
MTLVVETGDEFDVSVTYHPIRRAAMLLTRAENGVERITWPYFPQVAEGICA